MKEKEIRKYDVELLSLIKKTILLYDNADKSMQEIDDFCNNISQIQQKCDYIQSDLLHKLESPELKDEEIIGLGRAIQKDRLERRAINNACLIKNEYLKCKNKLPIKCQRQFFNQSINLKVKELNEPYKNRVISNEEFEKIMALTSNRKNKKKTPKDEINKSVVQTEKKERKNAVHIDETKLIKLKEEGKLLSEIAEYFKCSIGSVRNKLKEIKK